MDNNFNTLMTGPFPQDAPMPPIGPGVEEELAPEVEEGWDDDALLELFARCKKESFDDRNVFERQWLRNIYYTLGRQWLEYHVREGQWRDKRLAKWVPKPVTNKCKETVEAIRAVFTSIKIGVNVRPNGQDPKDVAAASTADEMAPSLHEEHDMNWIMSESDWWMLVTGNAFIHTFWDYDPKYGVVKVAMEQCGACGALTSSDKLKGAQPVCPECKAPSQFTPATDPMTGEPQMRTIPQGRGTTLSLSPLEVAFPNSYARFDDLPYIIRLRWRTKSYFEGHPALKELVPTLQWTTSPTDRSLQIFRSMATQNDMGVAPIYWSDGSSSSGAEEGITEYELHYKACDLYPEGLILRVVGEANPQILHLEETENVPGVFPYKDYDDSPLFTFAHMGYEHVGGRIFASGALDTIIQKQDQLNQLDSMIQMIVQRMANPVWLEPKGAEVEKFTGEPGLVVKWNPLTVGGNAKPERIPGEGPHGSFFQIREQYLKDIEELAGTFDIIKGAKPTGVEAFSALQLLVERSQSRFAGPFQARGDLYKNWFKFAIELERDRGPEKRSQASLSPSRAWTFKNFQNAQLQGSISIIVEDGSNVPKTTLGFRAAVEHASQLNMLPVDDPDTQYEGLKAFGLQRMVPSLDTHVQAALQKHQKFEDWAADPAAIEESSMKAEQDMMESQQVAAEAALAPPDPMTGMPPPPPPAPSPLVHTPLKWRRWYHPKIHKQEFLKWANSDRIRQLLEEQPNLEGLLEAHLMEMDLAAAEEMAGMIGGQLVGGGAEPPPSPGQGGSGSAMRNSNQQTTKDHEPKGNSEGNQGRGPA